MKRQMLLAVLVSSGLIGLMPRLARADSVASVQPPTTSTTIGNTVALNVDISNLADLFSYQFDVDFNPSVLSAIGVAEGSFLPSGGSTFFIPGTIDNVGGTVAFNADTLLGPGPGVNGSGVLLTVDFTTIGSGVSSVDLANLIFLDSTGAPINVSTSGGTVDVGSAVTTPEPATMLLFITSLIALVCLMRVKNRPLLL